MKWCLIMTYRDPKPHNDKKIKNASDKSGGIFYSGQDFTLICTEGSVVIPVGFCTLAFSM